MTTHQETLEAGEETPAQEFSRLVIEFNEGERQNRTDAWNLIADFACEHADAIIRGFRAADTITAQAARLSALEALLDKAVDKLAWVSQVAKDKSDPSWIRLEIITDEVIPTLTAIKEARHGTR